LIFKNYGVKITKNSISEYQLTENRHSIKNKECIFALFLNKNFYQYEQGERFSG
jgi:hypothetical protein